MRKLRLPALVLLALAALTPKTYADYYTVQLTNPASSEWTEDTYGGIWHANIAMYTDAGASIGNTTGLIMCTGDYRDIYIGQVTGPYTPLNVLAATPTQIASDPGNYQFLPGFSLASRTPDVQAKVAYLIDQLHNAIALPSTGNLQGLAPDDWIESKGDALVAAIHNLWDGVPFTAVNDPYEPLEAPIATLEYNQYLAAVANINALNYTSSQSLWLLDPNAQVLFANLSAVTPPDPTAVPEPASLSLLALSTLTLLNRRRK